MENSYPKFLYHKTKEPVVVNSKEAHDALGRGWAETPFTQETPQQVLVVEEVAEPKKSKGK